MRGQPAEEDEDDRSGDFPSTERTWTKSADDRPTDRSSPVQNNNKSYVFLEEFNRVETSPVFFFARFPEEIFSHGRRSVVRRRKSETFLEFLRNAFKDFLVVAGCWWRFSFLFESFFKKAVKKKPGFSTMSFSK